MRFAAETADDIAQCAVVEVEYALPGNAAHIEVERIALLDMIVDNGC